MKTCPWLSESGSLGSRWREFWWNEINTKKNSWNSKKPYDGQKWSGHPERSLRSLPPPRLAATTTGASGSCKQKHTEKTCETVLNGVPFSVSVTSSVVANEWAIQCWTTSRMMLPLEQLQKLWLRSEKHLAPDHRILTFKTGIRCKYLWQNHKTNQIPSGPPHKNVQKYQRLLINCCWARFNWFSFIVYFCMPGNTYL